LTGTWVIDEIHLAVEKGYTIREIYEFYEYQVTQYNCETGDGGLFVAYIDTFLKLKAKASGYRSWVPTPDDEDTYIDAFWKSEVIRLDKDAIRHNPAKRGLAKLCLNSMWGKLTQRNNRTKTEMISEPKELYTFLSTPGNEVTSLLFVSDHLVWLSWHYAEEKHIPNLQHTNEVIGAYVTTGGRMQLYRYLDTLQVKALYCDTDPVIYVQPKDEPPLILTAESLGAITSELKPDECIAEYVGMGPKNYAYRTLNPATGESKTFCKLRGITLNYNASQIVNFA